MAICKDQALSQEQQVVSMIGLFDIGLDEVDNVPRLALDVLKALVIVMHQWDGMMPNNDAVYKGRPAMRSLYFMYGIIRGLATWSLHCTPAPATTIGQGSGSGGQAGTDGSASLWGCGSHLIRFQGVI